MAGAGVGARTKLPMKCPSWLLVWAVTARASSYWPRMSRHSWAWSRSFQVLRPLEERDAELLRSAQKLLDVGLGDLQEPRYSSVSIATPIPWRDSTSWVNSDA